ncbi:hypothetical protein P153DRAFT_383219 [Dothidotthia symphoricarpi CBS 119687]|uniref:DUF6535 domain-containing protein n=1 Tax=Dothidotthia symphoricarpi CBS 119687 TaxID=1392245 RepID=A0A6A6AK50_9PLEO|nr:uncharacterized protein P153DRAFT_383219 [Dothidotthia symphoricarpi CBS 119687]KAF2132332.1 hypothetical protein P153DRAFT_383219 [Dothidotthia symphoricarpi CBS 119687]
MSGPLHTQAAVESEDMEQQISLHYHVLKTALAIFTAPYRRAFRLYTWRPLKEIRAAKGDSKVLIPLIKDWKEDKYGELQSVQVAATFCGGANLSILSYASTSDSIWIADALWFSSLICSIWAIVTTIQTKSILDDLPAREELNFSLPEYEVQRVQRTILRYTKTPGINHWIMVFVWQFPSMTMAYAWCTFLGGLTVYMCTPFIQNLPWQDRHKVAIAYLVVGFIGLVTYVLSTAFVYVGEKDFERSVASSHISTCITANELEAGIQLSGAGNSTNKTNNASVEETFENARAEAFIGYEHEERAKKKPERAEKALRRQLLY